MINGNITAVFQTKVSVKNTIGTYESDWADYESVKGWLDLSSGDSKHNIFSAKVQQSTNIFLCDYNRRVDNLSSEETRAIINNHIYEVMLIDNPMQMNQHLEVYLKFTGGQ